MTTVAEFKIDYHQVLDPEGKLVARLPSFAEDVNEVVKMYEAMTRVRVFDTKAVNLQRTGQLGTYPPSLGHEATHIGVGAAMRPEDVLAPVYREFGTQLWRGVTMTEILKYWGGDESGNDFAGPRHDFAWCVPIATQTLHAAGAAMAFKVKREPRCALAYIGDGGTSEGAFYEALNLSGARKLPVVFVVVNNGWAISVPLKEQTATQTLAQKSIAAGIPGIQVDGNDVFAVRDVVSRALETARTGGGPCLIETLTYRLSDHTTADDASRYRSDGEVRTAWTTRTLAAHPKVSGECRRVGRRKGSGPAARRRGPSRRGRDRISPSREALHRYHVRSFVRRAAHPFAGAARDRARLRNEACPIEAWRFEAQRFLKNWRR
jgi:2-oxoisovalerate dehydrogenase E1 component alpha subunit